MVWEDCQNRAGNSPICKCKDGFEGVDCIPGAVETVSNDADSMPLPSVLRPLSFQTEKCYQSFLLWRQILAALNAA